MYHPYIPTFQLLPARFKNFTVLSLCHVETDWRNRASKGTYTKIFFKIKFISGNSTK